MIRRLRKKFIRIAMLSVMLVITLLIVIVNAANFISTDSELTEMLKIISDNQGTIPRIHRNGVLNDKRNDMFTKEMPYATRYFVLQYSENGTLTNSNLSHIAAVTEEDTNIYLSVALRHGEGFGYISGYKYYVIYNGSGRYMAVFLDCYQELRSIKIVAALSLLAGAVCIALVYVLVVLFSKKAIDPIVRSTERQKQFITDAGHELKTPVTVISTSLKVLEMEVGKQKWIDKAQAQADKMSDLVNSLVALARMDEENPPVKPTDFNISEAVTETAESFREYAEMNGHGLELKIEPGIKYYGDEYLVRQLISILTDNAVKYTSDGGTIHLSLKRERHGVAIRASNPCEPLKTADLNKLFDRFYRADKSRSSFDSSFGVGLSIARSIAETHKGYIKAKRPSEGEIEFIVMLK